MGKICKSEACVDFGDSRSFAPTNSRHPYLFSLLPVRVLGGFLSPEGFRNGIRETGMHLVLGKFWLGHEHTRKWRGEFFCAIPERNVAPKGVGILVKPLMRRGSRASTFALRHPPFSRAGALLPLLGIHPSFIPPKQQPDNRTPLPLPSVLR